MTDLFARSEGAPCWFELVTTDQEAGKQFYSDMFGWSSRELPVGPDQTYTIFQKDGADVAGAFLMSKDMQEQRVPSHWGVFFATPDVDKAVGRVVELGGEVLAPPFNAQELGRMAVCRDPAGASFRLWQARKHPGVGVFGETNTVCWAELSTRDGKAAEEFYKGLLGWTTKGSPGSHAYIQFAAGGRECGGIMEMDASWGDAPPYWGIYLCVDDCDGVASELKRRGGTLMKDPFDAPGVGRIAIAGDPQGSLFSLITLGMNAA